MASFVIAAATTSNVRVLLPLKSYGGKYLHVSNDTEMKSIDIKDDNDYKEDFGFISRCRYKVKQV
jgi:type IV secretory pathway component VirB8